MATVSRTFFTFQEFGWLRISPNGLIVSRGRFLRLRKSRKGKSILAYRCFKEILSENKLLKLTWGPISSVRALFESFRRIPDQGQAIDDEEARRSARSIGVPTLISQNRPVVAIAISGPMSILEQQVVSLLRGAL